MKTKDIIAGMQILLPYYESAGYETGCEHDVLYMYPTQKPVSPEDVAKLVELGWFQEDADYEPGEYKPENYDPEEGWTCYV